MLPPLGVLKAGTVSVNGTHIRANASKDKNVRYDRAGELEEQLKQDIAELLNKAEQTDTQEKGDGQSLPDDIARRERLLEKMQQARKDLEERAQARAAAEQADYERKVEDRDKRSGKHKGKKIQPPKDKPEDNEQVNLADSDSRLMRKSKRESYTQSYNGQAAVDADGSQLVLSNHVSQCASDANELEPVVNGIPACLGEVSAGLADSGYVNADAIERLEATGRDSYVAVGRDDGNLERTYEYRPRSATQKPAKVVKDPRLLDMQEKVNSDEGRALYAKRKQTVEPVFGIIKSVMGFRQFLLCGLTKVSGEWDLVCLAYNVKRLWTLKNA